MTKDKMVKLNSLSLFVGTGECNARCGHCAGVPLRKYAPKKDGILDRDLIYKTLNECYSKGARYLSLSSSGEPTLSPLSVTKTLKLVYDSEMKFSPINLYSNGIRIGKDKSFCDKYLQLWKDYGLTTIYVTVHNINEKKNAKNYGVKNYPSLEKIIFRIHNAGLLMRANLVLSKKAVGTFKEFTSTVNYLRKIGTDKISAWPIRGLDDKLDYNLVPSEKELDKMENFAEETSKVKLLREKSKILYKPGKKLTLFPNGMLSNTWCN